MIRAIVRDGVIRPVDPLPPEWGEGQELIVNEVESDSLERAELEAWHHELQALGPARYEPGERERIEAMLVDADEQAKAVIRRDMGLE